MTKGYVFLSNSTKPTEEQNNSRDPIRLTNVSRPCLQTAIEMGYEVFFGENRNNPEELEVELPVHVYDSHTYRRIFAFSDNRIAYKNLCKIIEDNDIRVIHCNTPVGGIIGRICGKKYKVDKVIYTAHGFHFYKGAPLINRTVFKFAEKVMARWTDVIITMNQEDYESALRFKLRNNGKVYKVHGVGIKLSDYQNLIVDRKKIRSELGLSESDVVCVSAGDIVSRKNYIVAIEAIAKVNSPNLHYLICGTGPEKKKLEERARDLGVIEQVHFLGYRNDVKQLFKASDIFLFTTLQEGLPRSLMEAMALGLPVIASKIRGNVDLINDNEGGYLRSPYDVIGFAECIKILINNVDIRMKMAKINLNVIQEYDTSVVKTEIEQIYKANLTH